MDVFVCTEGDPHLRMHGVDYTHIYIHGRISEYRVPDRRDRRCAFDRAFAMFGQR